MAVMPIATQTPRLTVLLLPLIVAGCGGGEEVTVQSIGKAKQLWEQARVRDYNLEWTTSGRTNGHYRVEVREGQVRSVDSVLADGRTLPVPTAEPKYYGVEGLFTIIKDELAQLQFPEPFGQPKGTKIILRFTSDPKLGFPRRYRRDVLGTPQTVAIDVIRFEPKSDQPEKSLSTRVN
jgi:hypothetical protein